MSTKPSEPESEVRDLLPAQSLVVWLGHPAHAARVDWNVSGLSAVELTCAKGRKFRLGADEPEKLAEALRSALEGSGRG